ncbi:hypothetical protein J008_03380 [Cryptococcus neoformans]|uniref:Uncharacterized protein n=1 Tax=Cryptococcus neoformans Tu259-1 TaxID=1230072 RepID=A0A854QA21_CRYNE|nr:hypothetical protein C362_02996 [Cryptococcus neoformans var. grubii Bt1]OXG20827.1 hypothetical protein C361_03806 [Cryptococcus neoformans var. grubii Tu259-1]OXG25466.1 hypothetical protein C367_03290 [Cryptococcus neoformans var. grubii Ze90-1]OXH32060.1 hypothetical protein J008_03380 [Cryptococcus neoformans var. grubii]
MGSHSRNRSRSRSPDRGKDRDRERHGHRHRNRSSSPRRDRHREDRNRSHGTDRDRGHDHLKSKRDKVHGTTPSDEESLLDLDEMGVKEISEEDYFLKSNEFRLWLKEERGKYLDEMSSEYAHKYFRKFSRRWNDGALNRKYYHSPEPLPATSSTAYRWSFASGGDISLPSVRADVGRMTKSSVPATKPGRSADVIGPSYGPTFPLSTMSRKLGPTLPSASDRQYAMETEQEARKAERKAAYKEDYRRADEIVPRSGGKEGKMEEKRATNAENRVFREKDVTAGLEVDEGTLMGDSGSFAAALRRRDEAEARRRERKEIANLSTRSSVNERLQERKQKETATMEMFKAMAKERFG